jgi:hypothetical protein
MSEPRRSDIKRNQTQFLGGTEEQGAQRTSQESHEAREAAVANAYEPLGGLKQLGEVGGGVFCAACSQQVHGACPALRRLPPSASASCSLSSSRGPQLLRRGRCPDALQRHRHSTSTAAGSPAASSLSSSAAPLTWSSWTGKPPAPAAAAPPLAAASVPASPSALTIDDETACDDLDSGLFHLDQPHCYCCMRFFAGAGSSRSHKVDGHVWCRACSYQVHGDTRGNGGQHPEFATIQRPNDRCSGCPGCTA